MILTTERLILREWCKADLAPMAAINRDPKVMEFFTSTRTLEETAKSIEWGQQVYKQYGYCFYPVELKETGELIGYVGLNYVDWQAPFTPAVEIGWRLGSQFWGHGYALEAATAVRDFAFNSLEITELVSFTVPTNIRSIKLMQRLGFTHNKADDFEHPNLAPGHPLRKHVLYRLARR